MTNRLIFIVLLLVSIFARAEYHAPKAANRVTTPSDLSIRIFPQSENIYTEEEFYMDFGYVCEDESFLATHPVVLAIYEVKNPNEACTANNLAGWSEPIILPVSTPEQDGYQLWTKLQYFDDEKIQSKFYYRIQCEDDKSGYVYSFNIVGVKQGKYTEPFEIYNFGFEGDLNAVNPDRLEFWFTISEPYRVRNIQDFIKIAYVNPQDNCVYFVDICSIERPRIYSNSYYGSNKVKYTCSIDDLKAGDNVPFYIIYRIDDKFYFVNNLPEITVTMAKSSGVDDVMAEPQTVEYYNLNGVRVENPGPGLYIRRSGTKVEKVHLS